MNILIKKIDINQLTKKQLIIAASAVLTIIVSIAFFVNKGENKEQVSLTTQIMEIIKSEDIQNIEEKIKFEKSFTEHISKSQDAEDDSLISSVTSLAKDALLTIDADVHLVVKASFSPNLDNVIVQEGEQGINVNLGRTKLVDVDTDLSKTIVSYKKSGLLVSENDQEKSIILEAFLNNKDKFKNEMKSEFISSANDLIKRHIKRSILEKVGSGVPVNVNIKEE